MLFWLTMSMVISGSSAYGMCGNPPRCAPGCFKLDERGCLLCACGVLNFHPGGYHGMPQVHMGGGGFVPGSMSGFGAVKAKPLSQCPGTKLCMQTCKGRYSLGQVGRNGCKSCTCKTSHMTQVSSHSSYVAKPQTHVTYVVQQKQASCTGTKLCMMTCKSRYVLGAKGRDGCNTCSCAPEPTPAPTKAPAKMSCMSTVMCMLTCKNGYQLGATKSNGCQECTCIVPKVVVMQLTCSSSLKCSSGCNVGYKCGTDGCPTCDCIKPQVVGLTKVVEVVQKQVTCSATFSCPSKCSLGYKCGTDGCPTCECLVAVHPDQKCSNGCNNANTGSNYVVVHSNTKTCNGNCETKVQPNIQFTTHTTGSCHDCSSSGSTSNNSPEAMVNGGQSVGMTAGQGGGFINSGFSQHPLGSVGQGFGGGQSSSGKVQGPLGSIGQGPFNSMGGSGPFNPNTYSGKGHSSGGVVNGQGMAGSGPFNPNSFGNAGQGSGGAGNGQGMAGSGPFNPNSYGGGMTSTGTGSGQTEVQQNNNLVNTGGQNSGLSISQSNSGTGITQSGMGSGTVSQSFGNILTNQGPVAGMNTTGTGPFQASGYGFFTNDGFKPSPYSQAASGSTGQGPFAQTGDSSGKGPFAGTTGTSNIGGQGMSNGSGQIQVGQSSQTVGSHGPFSTNQGPYSTMQGSHGPQTQSSQGPFTAIQGGHGSQTGSNQGQFTSIQGGQGPQTGSSQGPFTSMQGGHGPTTGGGQGPINPVHGTGLLGLQNNANVDPSFIIKNCPETMHCMGQCPMGYQLKEADEKGCPSCSCLGAKGETMQGLPHQNQIFGQGQVGKGQGQGPFSAIGQPTTGKQSSGQQLPLVTSTPPTSGGAHSAAGNNYGQHSHVMACSTTFYCPHECSVGYIPGPDGCPSCNCAGGYEQKPVIVTEPIKHPAKTEAVTILKQCPSTFNCMTSCKEGYTLGSAGHDGCPACTCARVQKETCDTCHSSRSCDVTISCMATCEHGYILGNKDHNGCPSCRCSQECNTCEVKKPVVVVQQKESCHNCETIKVVQPVKVVQPAKEECHECGTSGGTLVMNSGSGGGMLGGGGGRDGMSGGIGGGGGRMGMTGGSECRPLPPNCHPSCVKYDVAHCRICECRSNPGRAISYGK